MSIRNPADTEESTSFTTLAKLQIGEIIESDLGIYTCTMQGVREMGDVTFEGSFRINRDMINEHRLTQTNISASCVLKMTLGDFERNQSSLRWHKAKEIQFLVGNYQHELTQEKEEYAVDKLTIQNVDENEHEGKYACRTGGGFSNEIYLKVDVDASWSEWQGWTKCSQSCEGGERTRQRECQPHRHGGLTCEDCNCLDNKKIGLPQYKRLV